MKKENKKSKKWLSVLNQLLDSYIYYVLLRKKSKSEINIDS